ncbi:DUF1963 domain-containing protein [Streptomyces sp. BRB081]|uniref:DUF1963 domain-containing protein n=1 Tax=Streptomyces sp. BRB081 TaxID=2769544 RepID=UPI0018ACF890|nr:DUF1963 domain-containing protein [Streptomyces sp. BRB081]MBL3803075.1 DUF1963 domain-containing protein [Streptomyces sp. BRB081]
MIEHRNTDRVHRFRAEAASRGLPAHETEEWLKAVKPAVFWTYEGDGPVAARLGGDALLPREAPTPTAPLVATVDCSLLPSDTGLPLPADGHLLFFAEPNVSFYGSKTDIVRYVPAGTRTTARPADSWYDAYPSHDLRMAWFGTSTPDTDTYASAKWGDDLDDEELDRVTRLVEDMDGAWTSTGGLWPMWTLALGGNTIALNCDPLDSVREDEPEDAEDWVLLATWRCGEEVKQLDQGVISWLIRRTDLASLRFDRAYLWVDM